MAIDFRMNEMDTFNLIKIPTLSFFEKKRWGFFMISENQLSEKLILHFKTLCE